MRFHGRRPQGESVELVLGEAIPLDEGAKLLFVESGSIGIFHAAYLNGVPAGPRHFLFRVTAGSSVVSISSKIEDGMRLLALPLEETNVVEGSIEGHQGVDAGLSHGVREWVEALSSLLGGLTAPALSTRAGPEGEYELEPDQALTAERGEVVWCEVLDGIVNCMGMGEIPLNGRAAVFPLCAGMWVQADGVSRVRTVREDAAAILAGMTHLFRVVIHHLGHEQARELEEERIRLRDRKRRQEIETAGAFERLARVFTPRRSPIARDTALLTAAAAVGQALGVEVRPPLRYEDLRRVGDPLDAIARASRVRTRRVLLRGDWWRRDCGPLLAYTEEGQHPVALIPGKRLKYELFDPREGKRVPLTSEWRQQLAPAAVMMYRPLPDASLGLRDLVRFGLRPFRRDLWLVLTAGLMATFLGMLTPIVTGIIMDQAIPDANGHFLEVLAMGLLFAALGRAAFLLAQGFVLLRIHMASEAESQSALWDRLLRVQPSFFRKFSTGDLQSRVVAVQGISRAMGGAVLRSLVSGFLALLNLILLFIYSPPLAVVALFVALAAIAFVTPISVLMRRQLQVLAEMEGRLFGFVIQLINGVAKLRVAGAEGRAYANWLKQYGDEVEVRHRALRLEDGVQVFNQILPLLSSILIFFFAHQMMLEQRVAGGEGGLSLGTFLAFSVAFSTMLSGATDLSSIFVSLLDAFAKARRTAPILEAIPEVDATKADPGRLSGELALSRVDFRYRPDGPLILDGISLKAEPGEFVALVGPSGSGKSTILRLLLGFETPESGTVSFDGQDLSGLDVIGVRRQLGVVLQNGRLNTGSIFNNLACGNVITLDEAWAAAEEAGFADDIHAMPMGVHTVISEGGGNLSGGQRQRLLIARALVLRPKILLFDEATSALDNRTQAIVSSSLERLNVTRVAIAHRLSTIRKADRIYVLDAGRVVQEGAFEDMMEREGLFRRMMRRQML